MISGAALTSLYSAICGARNAILTGLAVAVLVAPVSYCTGLKTAKSRYEAQRALANAKALARDAQAKGLAAGERAADALRISTQEEELIDAIQSVPDDKPDRVRVALGCERLRQAGTRDADLPGICRPEGRDGSQAGAAP